MLLLLFDAHLVARPVDVLAPEVGITVAVFIRHVVPRTTKLYDRTSEQITLDEVERIAI